MAESNQSSVHSQNEEVTKAEPIENYDESGLDTTDSGGYGVNAQGNAFSRRNQMGTDGYQYKSQFTPYHGDENAVDDDDGSNPPSGATTPGGPFRGGVLTSYVGDPKRDYASDQAAGAAKRDKEDDSGKVRRYSETNPDRIGG